MVSLLHFWHFLALLCVCSLECISNSLQPCYRIFFAVHPEEKNLLCLNERLHYCIPSSEGIFSSISSILASACSSCLSSCSRIGFSLCSASFSIPAILPFAVRMARILALNSLASASASSSSSCFLAVFSSFLNGLCSLRYGLKRAFLCWLM